MEFKGTVVRVGEVQKVTEKFTKRELILTDNHEKYPQFIAFTFSQGNCDLLDFIQPGEVVTVHFSLRGREWKGKYFNELSAFKIVQETQTNSSDDLPF